VTVKVNPRDGQAYVWIPPGRFVMGCSEGDSACDTDEKPVHQVNITRGFWLSRTEVTAAQYRKGMPTGSATGPANASTDLPVSDVNWANAKAYCARAGGRLPTEAEWEYAARAGSRTRYYDSLTSIAWFSGNSDDHPHPVATRAPNAFGLYDMLGNMSEWVLDRYYNAYDDTSDPAAPDQPLAGNASGVARGGSWVSESEGVRVSRRLEMPPDAQEPHIGFRCALDRL
jgi:formylglycine-generating enzyme required for sulfatase activity